MCILALLIASYMLSVVISLGFACLRLSKAWDVLIVCNIIYAIQIDFITVFIILEGS